MDTYKYMMEVRQRTKPYGPPRSFEVAVSDRTGTKTALGLPVRASTSASQRRAEHAHWEAVVLSKAAPVAPSPSYRPDSPITSFEEAPSPSYRPDSPTMSYEEATRLQSAADEIAREGKPPDDGRAGRDAWKDVVLLPASAPEPVFVFDERHPWLLCQPVHLSLNCTESVNRDSFR